MKKILLTILLLIILPITFATLEEARSELKPWQMPGAWLMSVSGDNTCCYNCDPNEVGYINKGNIKQVDCGGNIALIDFYYRNNDGTGQVVGEYVAPKTITCPNNIGYDKCQYECYYCTTGNEDPQAELTPCSSNNDCQQYGSWYVCDGGYCHLQDDCYSSWQCQNGQYIDINNCPVANPEKPSGTCSSGNGDGATDWSIENPDFKVSIINVPDKSDEIKGDGKTDVTITVRVTNNGGTKDVVGGPGCMRVEAGIQPDEALIGSQGWWTSQAIIPNVQDTYQCIENSPSNVAKLVCLNHGESVDVKFTFKTPYACSGFSLNKLTGWTDDYDVYTDAHVRCYNDDVATGETSHDIENIPLVAEWTSELWNNKCGGTCSDDLWQQGKETDVDCGGRCINENKLCGSGFRCEESKDCQSPYECGKETGRCVTADVAKEEAARVAKQEGNTKELLDCPDSDTIAECIPEGCNWVDVEGTTLKLIKTEVTTKCCVGSKKVISGEANAEVLSGWLSTTKSQTGICVAQTGLAGLLSGLGLDGYGGWIIGGFIILLFFFLIVSRPRS